MNKVFLTNPFSITIHGQAFDLDKIKFMKTEQNFGNHSRLSFFFHGIITMGCLVAIVSSAINLYRTISMDNSNTLPSYIFLLASILLFLIAFAARSFALKAQDRAIRAEESLRYYAITGDMPPRELTIGQFIALRFAPNNELVDLAERAVKENLSNKDIKKAIKHWKGDYYRV